MKKYILMAFAIFLAINSYALYTETFTAEQKKSRLSACKKIKDDNKWHDLTAKDQLICEELISANLLSSYEDNKQIANNKISKNKKLDDRAKNFIKEAQAQGFSTEEINKFLIEKGYDIEKNMETAKLMSLEINWADKLARCKEIQNRGLINKLDIEKQKMCRQLIANEEEKIKEEIKNEKRNQLIGNITFIVGILFLLFCCWLLLFVVFPKLIYVLRKAWLKAAEDAKK